MEVDIIQHNDKSASLVASSSRWTFDRENDHQESQSLQGPTLSALSMPYECLTRQASRNPVPSSNLDTDELYIVRRAEIAVAVAPSELSALARWKKATKLQRPRTTRRHRSNSTAINASAGRQPTGHHPPLQALPSWSSLAMLGGRRRNNSGSMFHAESTPRIKAYKSQSQNPASPNAAGQDRRTLGTRR